MTRPLYLLFLVAGVCSVASAQDPERAITASYPPQPLGRLIPALAKQTGLDLQVARAIENDVVMIRVKRVPLNLLLGKIATVTNRAWDRKGDRYTLTTSIEADRAAEKRVLARRTETIRKAILKSFADPVYRLRWTQEEAVKLANKTEAFMSPKENGPDGKPIRFEDLKGRSPVDRAFAALFTTLDPSELARGWEGRRVYATRPTAMQRPLPIAAQAIFERLFREQAMFVDASNDFRDRQGPSTMTVSMTGISRGEFGKGNPRLGLGKGILRIEGSEIDRTLTATLILTDAAGAQLIEGSFSLPIDYPEDARLPAKGPEPRLVADPIVQEFHKANATPPVSKPWKSFTVTDGKQFLQLNVPFDPSQRKPSQNAQIKPFLISPNVTDPLSLCAGKILDAAAAVRGENVVACLDDGVFATAVAEVANGATPTQCLNSFFFQDYQEVEVADGWMTVQLRDPAGARKRRTDRDALAKLLRSVDRNKLLLLDDLCAFSLTQEEAMASNRIDLAYLQLLNPGAVASYDPEKWHVYQFFGSLTGPQKQVLGGGAGVPVQNLTPSGRKALGQYLFEADVEPQFSSAEGDSIDISQIGTVMDWTQLLPNGLQNGAMVTAKVRREDAAYCVDSFAGLARILNAANLANLRFLRETPGLQNGAPRFDRFSPATQWVYSFKIALAPGIGIQPEVTDGAIDGVATSPDMASLPGAFQKSFAEKLQAYRKYFGHMTFTGQRQGLPP